jgi:O-antigen biosynthesis protein
MITSEGENLVFILSLPRSGSTLLSIVMGANSQVYCPPEPWFLLRLAEVYGEAASEQIFDDYYASLATRAFMNEESFLKSARAFALQAYNNWLEQEGKAIFVDKTPRYYHILDFIDQLFPKAKKVWLKRNPLDVAVSYKRSWRIGIDVLTGQEIVPAAFDFTEGLHKYLEYFAKESAYKFEVKYEDIVSSPKKTIIDLCRFCGIAFEDEMLQLGSSRQLFQVFEQSAVGDRAVLGQKSFHTSSIGRWKKELSEEELTSLFGIIGKRAFERMGYEQPVGENIESALRGAFAEIENRIAFRKDLYRKTRFGVIYRELRECRLKANRLEEYVSRLEEYVSQLKGELQRESEKHEIHLTRIKRELQRQADIANGYLKSILASRYLKLGWKLGLARKPAWVDRYLQERKFLPGE